jgi:hypothetical protein
MLEIDHLSSRSTPIRIQPIFELAARTVGPTDFQPSGVHTLAHSLLPHPSVFQTDGSKRRER